MEFTEVRDGVKWTAVAQDRTKRREFW